MSLSGKKVAQIAIKSNLDVFHQLWMHKPHHIKHLSPDLVHACEVHEGEFGRVGSVISWKYVHDGKIRFSKQIITEINEEKKLISFKNIEGDLLEIYKYVQITLHVETSGDDNLVTWTVEYEKLNESVPDPDTLMEMLINVIKDIETGHLSLTGKRVAQIDIKSDADVFHELWKHKPHQIKDLSPEIIQACNLHDGEFGRVGTVISWHYFHDGKNRVAKEIITDINEEKKLISFKLIEGDLMELYKSMLSTVHVETNGDDNLVTWTVEYEKLHDGVHDPDTLMEMLINLTKDIEASHLKPNK